jgi:hypothetical protein
MALKDWKRAKSGESKNYPVVYRKKSDGDDVVAIRFYQLFNVYEVHLNDYSIFHSKNKSEALKKLMDYMRSH